MLRLKTWCVFEIGPQVARPLYGKPLLYVDFDCDALIKILSTIVTVAVTISNYKGLFSRKKNTLEIGINCFRPAFVGFANNRVNFGRTITVCYRYFHFADNFIFK